jgi:rfaE bifunctional protein nucleotidyltransferase chain/domain
MTYKAESKLKSVAELQPLICEAQAKGRRVVFANGCFDLLHVGHIRYLEDAKALGDLLVVALNSDKSVAALKGPGRPIQSQEERTEIVESLEPVDYVVILDAPTAGDLLLELKPDIHAKGTDYTVDTVPEKETVRSYGGRVAIVGDPKNHSTRDLIERVRLKVRRD